MGLFVLGIVMGLLLGATGLRLAWHETYMKKLERVANLAELMIRTRKTENERLKELRQAVDSLRGVALSIRGQKPH